VRSIWSQSPVPLRDELVDLAGADPARHHGDPRAWTVGSRADRPGRAVRGPTSYGRQPHGAQEPRAPWTRPRAPAAEGIDLVAVGGDRPQFRDDAAPSSEATAAEAITWLGHVDDTDLPGLYAGASAFVLPSLYEGFGLTALEAMASGTPVVASDRGALPQVVGDAALLVDPEDPEGIADAVMRAIGDARLRAAGPRQAAAFTWRATTERLDALMRRLLDQRG
jgi:glycosyltransferase involved in cell wall biosynthesis